MFLFLARSLFTDLFFKYHLNSFCANNCCVSDLVFVSVVQVSPVLPSQIMAPVMQLASCLLQLRLKAKQI